MHLRGGLAATDPGEEGGMKLERGSEERESGTKKEKSARPAYSCDPEGIADLLRVRV